MERLHFFVLAMLLSIIGGRQTPAGEPSGGRKLPPSSSARRVLVIAHRGAHQQNPENTLAAFRKAIDLGCDYVEMDVRQTKDGALVIMHDPTVDRTTSGSGRVEDMTLANVRHLDVRATRGTMPTGEKVPTFDEALAVCKGKIKVYVDNKAGAPVNVISVIEKHGMLKDVIIYGAIDRLREFKRLRPEVWVICGHPAAREELAKLAGDLKPEALDGHQMKWSRDQVSDAHRVGAKVWVDALGPLDGPIGYQWAIGMGVDAIQTDYPESLLKRLNYQ